MGKKYNVKATVVDDYDDIDAYSSLEEVKSEVSNAIENETGMTVQNIEVEEVAD